MPAPNGTVSRKRGKAKMKLEWKRHSAMEKVEDLNSEDLDVCWASTKRQQIPPGCCQWVFR